MLTEVKDMKGMLHKQARGNSFRSMWGLTKTWALRWVVLEDGRMFYYKTPLNEPPSENNIAEFKGSMLVFGAAATEIEGDRPFTFEVRGCKEKDDDEPETLCFAASSDEERQKWIHALQPPPVSTKPARKHKKKTTDTPQPTQANESTTPVSRSTSSPTNSMDPPASTRSAQSGSSSNVQSANTATTNNQHKTHVTTLKRKPKVPTTPVGTNTTQSPSTSSATTNSRPIGDAQARLFRIELTKWVEHQDEHKRVYYHNTHTNETTWLKERVIATSWVEYKDERNNNKPYFYNPVTGITTWEPPHGIDVDSARLAGRQNAKVRELHERELNRKYSMDLRQYHQELSKQRVEEWARTNASLGDCLRNLHDMVSIPPDLAQRVSAVNGESSVDEVRKAYKRAVVVLHPDKLHTATNPAEKAIRRMVFDVLASKYQTLMGQSDSD